MSVTALDRIAPLARPVPARLAALWRSPLARAVLISRLLVLAAGVAGARVTRRTSWEGFDQKHLSWSMGAVGNLLGAADVRWDAIHYLDIAGHGYTLLNTVFYPLYPLLMRALGTLTGSLPLAGALISLGAFAVAIWLLAAVTHDELGPRAARATVMLLAFAPLSFFFSAIYTESLFLALSLGCLHAARRHRWPLAIALGALAALTRVTGVLLVVPLALIAWEEHAVRRLRIVGLVLIPGALLAYGAYLSLHGLDPLGPFTGETTYGRVSTGPLGATLMALRSAVIGLRMVIVGREPIYQPSLGGPLSSAAESIELFLVLCAALWTLRVAWRRLSRPYVAYAVAAVAVCLWSPTRSQPLISFDRYLLTIFPLWMVVGAWLSEREWLRICVFGVGAALLAFYTFQFATWAFIA